MNPHPRHPRLIGFVACLVLLVLLVGLPTVLLALGWGPVPSGMTGWWTALTSPDDGHLTVLVLEVVAWIVWGLLAVTILTEAVAALRGRTAPTLPGLRWTQAPAHRLVAAALLLFIAVPGAGFQTAAPARATPLPVSPTATLAPQAAARVETGPRPVPRSEDAPAAVTHTVKRGETLWSIAEHHLGAGTRYPEIVKLNDKVLHGRPQFLRPGWVLTLPAGTQPNPQRPDPGRSTCTVVEGDTLSEIAEHHLRDADAWPRIFEASKDLRQPDGRRLSDPDLILPGWTLRIPAAESAPSQKPADPGQATTPDARPTARGSATATLPAPTPATVTPNSTTAAGSVPDATPSATASPPPAPATATPHSTAAAVPEVTPSTNASPPAAPASRAVDASGADLSSDSAGEARAASTPWLLLGLSGGGAVLAAGLLAALRQRRRAQFRARRPGRTVMAPPPDLVPVERTLMTEGPGALATLTAIDEALRLLAVSGADGAGVPQLQAVQLLPGEVAVQLAEPATLTEPWRADSSRADSSRADSSADGRRWLLTGRARGQGLAPRAPYPLLVSVGQDDDGITWMVNLEQVGTVSLTGDPTHAADFARYLAAEIAVNPWSSQVQLDCVGVAAEVVELDPARIRHHPLSDAAALDAALATAGGTVDRCAEHQISAVAGRAGDCGGDVWDSRLVIVNGALSGTPLDRLLALVGKHPARTGTAVVMVGDGEPVRGLGVRLTGQGRLLIPALGLDLIANGLTPAEAEGCALLVSHADHLDDADMPTDGDDGWRASCDAAGALRGELVLPRDTDLDTLTDTVTTLVPGPDGEILEVAAATVDDLQQLAPLVCDQVRATVESADPALDADLAAWAAGTRPHLRLLGPILARTGLTGNPIVVAKRKAFYAELLAFLALHPQGVSIDQVVDAFNTEADQMRVHLSKLRSWLGIDPVTGAPYLPDATKSPAGIARGMGIYQLVGVLTDIDLFRRLRARGQARGPAGLTDLQAALGLVTGEPFTGQRERGWGWLADGVRVDQHMVCAVVDVAHLVAIAALHAGDLACARSACETAMLAAPYEDTPRLDLAAVVAATGDRQAAERILRDDVCNRTDNDQAPDDLPARTADLVTAPPWLTKGRVA